jgi:hypothetical protein
MSVPRRRADAPRRAVLMRRHQIDIDDVSRTGCRIEGTEPLAIGAVGMLTVEIDGQSYVELFRVSRTGIAGGDGRYEAGVEFLPMPADTPSLHDLAAQLDRTRRT